MSNLIIFLSFYENNFCFQVARAIGIPSRIVTTYSCAHDTQASLTVDYFVDESGKILEELNSDSIWNYHVWNEVEQI